MPSIFRCHGQEWILPVLPRENLLKIRPPLFVSYFFAIESNKRYPASSSNKHFLTEAYKTVIERTLGLHPGDGEMHRTLQRWKEDKYWAFSHGGAGDAYSTRAIHGVSTTNLDPNSSQKGKSRDTLEGTAEKQQDCFFWRRDGVCRRNFDGNCQYFHPKNGKYKESGDLKDKSVSYSQLPKAPAQASKIIECYYWGQGTCKYSAKDCKYAHCRIIDDVADRSASLGKREKVYDSADQVDPAESGNPSSSKLLECYYWRKNGFCKLSDEDCLYAHHPTGKVKEVHGLPKISDLDSYPLEARITSDPSRAQGNQHLDPALRSYTMPQPPTTNVANLTLAAFYDRFCYTNPTARKDPPWETVLSMFKSFVVRHFGKDSLIHVLAAYTRTELPIPKDILERQTIRTDDELELYKKEKASVRVSPRADVEGENNAQVIPSKRGRLEEADSAAPKRTKVECEKLITPNTLSPISKDVAEEATKPNDGPLDPVESRSRLYSPSMPSLTTLPNCNGRSPSTISNTSAEYERNNSLPVSNQLGKSPNDQVSGSPSLIHPSIATSKVSAMNGSGSKAQSQQPVGATVTESRQMACIPTVPEIVSGDTRTLSPPILRQRVSSSMLPRISPNLVTTLPKRQECSFSSSPDLEKSYPRGQASPFGTSPNLKKIYPKRQVSPVSISPGLEKGCPKRQASPFGTALKGCATHTHNKPKKNMSLTDTTCVRKSPRNGYPTFSSAEPDTDEATCNPGEVVLVTPQPPKAKSIHLRGNGTVISGSSQDSHSSSNVRDTPYAVVKNPYQESLQEPIGAHIVRLEALLKGALAELDTSVSRVATRPRVEFSYQEPTQELLGVRIVCVEALVKHALIELETLKRNIR